MSPILFKVMLSRVACNGVLGNSNCSISACCLINHLISIKRLLTAVKWTCSAKTHQQRYFQDKKEINKSIQVAQYASSIYLTPPPPKKKRVNHVR